MGTAGVVALIGMCVLAVELVWLVTNVVERRRIEATPMTLIAATAHGRLAAVSGIVIPSEQGVVVSPPSRREVVLYDVSVSAATGNESDHQEKVSRDFWIRDESGGYARVLPNDAAVIVECIQHGAWPGRSAGPPGWVREVDLTADASTWARAKAGLGEQLPTISEHVIAPGDRLVVLGKAERDAGSGVVFFRAHRGDELLLSTASHAKLKELYRGTIKFHVLVVAVTLTVVVVSLVAWFA
jgi:hypothetical protein